MKCRKCGSERMGVTPNKKNPAATDLFCMDCGAWQKFATKDEIRLYETCKAYRTNADHIRAMSDEELVVFLDGFSGRCLDCAEDAKNKDCPIYKEGYYCRPKDIMEWLQQPVEKE